MSSKSQSDGKKTVKNQSVTSRCVAIVLRRNDKVDNSISDDCETFENVHTEVPNPKEDIGSNLFALNSNVETDGKSVFDAKKVFAEFKLRNKTCYWNPALVDSVNNLEYVGFIEPLTILVKGDDIHLENIRTAWGRRVLKDPAHYYIERIGDVNGIEMQVIPQTQFIPLPEALCLIIMDLNNSQIVATLDIVCERLKLCYHGLHLPSNQHVYDTLGQLIRERKVFHTGCGYFVVTPDTFRMHGDDMQPTSLLSPWTHLHPMYIPAVFSHPHRQPMRSISCQVDAEHNLIGDRMSCDKQEKDAHFNEEPQIDLPSLRLQRSMSVSVRRPRDQRRRDDASDGGSIRRSSSVKGRNEKSKPSLKGEAKSDSKQGKTKEKMSLFSKIFGRNKKKQPPPETKKPPVEYATFSAQFPPPEWMWYQKQLDRQLRTENWVQQQMTKSGTWHHYLRSMPGNSPTTSLHMGVSSIPDRTSTLPAALPNTQTSQAYNHNSDKSGARKTNKKSHKHKDRIPIVTGDNREESLHIDKKHTYKNSMGQTNIRLSSLPMRLSPAGETLHSNYTSHPIFNSTPRFSAIPEHHRLGKDTTQIDADHRDRLAKNEKERSRSVRKAHKMKRKNHHDRHSSYLPMTRHISGMSDHTAAEQGNDISSEFQGQLPHKNTTLGRSHSSGVNCIGVEQEQSLTKGPRYQRSNSPEPCQTKGQRYQRSNSPEPNQTKGERYQRSNSPEPSRTKGQRYQRSNSYRHTVNETRPEVLQSSSGGHGYQRSHSYRHPVKDDETVSKTEVSGHIYANVHVSQEVKPQLPERMNRKVQGHGVESLSNGGDCLSGLSTHYRLELPESDRHSDHGSSSASGTLNSNSSHEPGSLDSAVEGTESSEHSLGTVIDTRLIANKHLERLAADAHELTLGDSGFSSPRMSEISSDLKTRESNITKGQGGFMCNNLKSGQRLNNSMGKLDDCSDGSFDRISSDRLYENVRLSKKEVINNMKYLHKDINVSSQNLNNQSLVSDSSSHSAHVDFDPKPSITKKFNLEGDFHVVGVV